MINALFLWGVEMARPKRACSVDGCKNNHHGKGFCERHLDRFNRWGSPTEGKRSRHDSLESRISYNVSDSGCWEWDRAVDKDGYGKLTFRGQSISAHRAAWEASTGKSAEGLVIRHTCDNPRCVNPSHLMSGGVQDNVDDRRSRGRGAVGSRQGRSKLTEERVVEIRLEKGTNSDVAAKFGVSPALISMVRNRRLWRHV